MRQTVLATIRPGEQAGYVAECAELRVVTQGTTLDETVANLREAVGLAIADEDLARLGLIPAPTVVVTFELESAVA